MISDIIVLFVPGNLALIFGVFPGGLVIVVPPECVCRRRVS